MAFVRIKRRRDENPAEALLLATKRKKLGDEEKTSLFEFTATLDYSDADVMTYLEKVRKMDSLKTNFKKPTNLNVTQDFIKEQKEISKNKRLEVINCFRALEDNSNEKPVTLVDVVSKCVEDSQNEEWVYDIYKQSNSEDVDDMLMERICSVLPIDFDTGDGDEISEEYFDCSDDSNDENNWRNDYPDEEDSSDKENSQEENEEHSICEEDMLKAVAGMSMYDLSSDDCVDDSDYEYSDSIHSDVSHSEDSSHIF